MASKKFENSPVLQVHATPFTKMQSAPSKISIKRKNPTSVVKTSIQFHATRWCESQNVTLAIRV